MRFSVFSCFGIPLVNAAFLCSRKKARCHRHWL